MSPVRLPGLLSDGEAVRLGVMGGGQLGRMFVQAAQRMGFDTVVLDPDVGGPAASLSQEAVAADYDDTSALHTLAQRCVAVTTEFENVPAASLRALAAQVVVAPSGDSVEVCQDRAAEKAYFERAGVACAPYAVIDSLDDVHAADAKLVPGILKTRRMGYDGKGQVRVTDRAQLVQAWQGLGGVSCVLEALLPLEREISVIVARGADGATATLPVQENLHRDGVLAVTRVPARLANPALAPLAVESALRIAHSLQYVGVLCVEFFVLRDGSLVANEMAPRPHNSGHYSMDACDVSQFDLQVRALAGLPLPQPRQHSPARMLNLLGDLWFGSDGQARLPPWEAVLELPGVHLHLYGKREARRGRKMGHITVVAADEASAEARARQVAELLGLPW